MPKKARLEHACDRLAAAMLTFAKSRRKSDRERAEIRAEATERFARIQAQMAEIMRLLHEQGRLLKQQAMFLEGLPGAVCAKIGVEYRWRPASQEIT